MPAKTCQQTAADGNQKGAPTAFFKGSQEKGGFCQKCEDDARERLDAIARGSLVLSLDEELPHRGHAAIFRGNDGTV
jgi:hypothetical protein